MNAERFFSSPVGLILAATGATFLWGSAFPFIKLSYEALRIGPEEIFEQMLFAGYRFVMASALIMVFILLIGQKIRYQKGTWPGLVKVGLFQTFFQYVLFYIGLSYSTGIQGSIIAGTTSFFQILLAHFMYKNDLLSVRKVIGLTIGFLGVILVSMTKGSWQLAIGIGEVLLLAAMFSGALGNVLSRNVSAKMNLLYLTCYQMLFGGIGLTFLGASGAGWIPFTFDLKSSFMLLYLAVLSAAGFVLWNSVMKYNPVGKVSMYMFLVPVFGVYLSNLMLGEEVNIMVAVALLLVVGGIIIVNRGKAAFPKGEMAQK
jgi:drug/metabolite transporter (DMT)-like permease